MEHQIYPRPLLEGILLGLSVAQGKAEIFCGGCGFPTDAISLTEISVSDFKSERDYKNRKNPSDTRFILLCQSCMSRHCVVTSVRGILYPPNQFPQNQPS